MNRPPFLTLPMAFAACSGKPSFAVEGVEIAALVEALRKGTAVPD
ncbi:MAG: hypothetical protein U5J83_13415 [Bryobacterales bacterium]|nr:hypothetical protein [Bryobacterales bacterium]